MRDLHLTTPQVGDRISRRYLQGIEALAGHNHDPGVGLVTRHTAIQPPPESTAAAAGQVIFTCQLTAHLNSGSNATATLLTGTAKTTNGGTITVYDTPASITAGYKIANTTKCRVFKDTDMDLAADEYVLLVPFACETAQ